MAIIAGKVPPPSKLAGEYTPRVVVKFRPEAKIPYSRDASTKLADQNQQAWKKLTEAFPRITLEPYFTSIEETALRTLERKGSPLTSFFAVTLPAGSDAKRITSEIASWPNVETAYLEAGPTPPPSVDPTNDPRNVNQRYQDAAPVGIDARWAWGVADGHDIGFVDLERGWTLNHEDLNAANITLISGVNKDYHGHGTAVLGEVIGVDNSKGGVGIAPRSTVRVVSQWRSTTVYSTADAIVSATAAMEAGDVLLLEAQTSHPNASSYVPVEVDLAVYEAIRAATDNGIVVVEAAGNGSIDLDTFQIDKKQILNRNSSDFRDSGAILVGAGSSSVPHTRLDFSNFGSRIDCYAWGENIDTSGDGWQGTSTTGYTTTFGGTSGASPIVTGAALLLQSWRVRSGHSPYSPATLRSLLTNGLTNTPSANPASDRIGVMPNLRAIIERVQFAEIFQDKRWRIVVRILFGVTQDGGGVIFVPGRGPVPIDPWTFQVDHLSAEKRDILVSLALTELSSLIEDSSHRRAMDRVALETMQKSLDRLIANR